jgi:hypothetical protein
MKKLYNKRVLFDGKKRSIGPNQTLLLMDLSRTRSMITKVCKRLKIDMNCVLFVWASPPCNTYSKVGTVNLKRNCHFRQYEDPEWPPRKDGSVYGKTALEHDNMNTDLVTSLMKANQEHGIQFAIENPRGGLRRRPFMNQLKSCRCCIDYCAFDHPFMKQTDIWTSAKTWRPTGITGDGKCHGRCNSGEINTRTGMYKHKKTIAGSVGRGPTGKNIKMQKSMVPDLMLDEILEAVCKANLNIKRRLVIDLFAGQGSLRSATLKRGLEYIAVDIIDRLNIL